MLWKEPNCNYRTLNRHFVVERTAPNDIRTSTLLRSVLQKDTAMSVLSRGYDVLYDIQARHADDSYNFLPCFVTITITDFHTFHFE